MSQIFTILFDLDGTLVNTAPDLMHAHNHVMKKYGFVERKLSDIRKLAGRGSKVMLARSMIELAGLQGKTKKLNQNQILLGEYQVVRNLLENMNIIKKLYGFYDTS